MHSLIDHLVLDGAAFTPDTMASNLGARILRTAVADVADRREILSAPHLGEKAAMRNFSDIGYVTQIETDLASVIKVHIQLQSIR